jgi:hypothetical protein
MKNNVLSLVIIILLFCAITSCLGANTQVEWVKYLSIPNLESDISSLFDSNAQRSIVYVRTQHEGFTDDYVFQLNGQGQLGKNVEHGLIDSPIIKAELIEDGGMVFLKNSQKDTPLDYYVEKVNVNNKVEWSKLFKGNGNLLKANDIIETDKGDFLVCGYMLSLDETYEIFLHRIDKKGNLIWQKTFSEKTENIKAYNIRQTENLGFVLVGKILDDNNEKLFVLKVNNQVGKQWQTIISNQKEEINDVCVLGNCIYIATSIKNKNDTYDCKLTKINHNGSVMWVKKFQGQKNDYCVNVKGDGDNIVLLVTSYSNDGDFKESYGNGDTWVIVINQDGKKVWQKCIGGSNEEIGQGICVTNNGYIIGGVTYSKDGDMKHNKKEPGYFLLKLLNRP